VSCPAHGPDCPRGGKGILCDPDRYGPAAAAALRRAAEARAAAPVPKLPPGPRVLLNAAGAAVQVAAAAAAGETLWASEETARAHLAICFACVEAFRPEDGKCADCGCHMETKVKLAMFGCPRGKWGPEEPTP
jgi:hypothetical protein